jgi:hypothetical protein
LIIALDVFVIWALCVYNEDAAQAKGSVQRIDGSAVGRGCPA